MGRETISSQELADYTHVNSTQIRRDLSGFGKFGKRGVGYNVDSLVSQIRKILRTTGKHNIALFGAGNLGQAIAGSDIFADHGFRVVALFDKDPAKVGHAVSDTLTVRPYDDLDKVIRDEDVVVGVLAVPTAAAQEVADDLVEAGRQDHLQLLRGPAPGAARGDRAYLESRSRPALRALLLPHLMLDMARVHEAFEASTDFTVGIEEEFAILDPHTLSLDQRFEELKAGRPGRSGARRVGRRRADQVGDRDPLRAGGDASPTRSSASARRACGCSGSPPSAERCSPRPAPIPGALAGAADHRHRALPAGGRRAPVRGLAQQHVLAARARGRARSESRGAGLRPAATGAARAAGAVGQLAVPGRARTPGCIPSAPRSSRRASRAVASPIPSAGGAGTPTTWTS